MTRGACLISAFSYCVTHPLLNAGTPSIYGFLPELNNPKPRQQAVDQPEPLQCPPTHYQKMFSAYTNLEGCLLLKKMH